MPTCRGFPVQIPPPKGWATVAQDAPAGLPLLIWSGWKLEIIRIHEQVVTAGMAAANGDARKPASAPGTRTKVAAANGQGPPGVRSTVSARNADLPNSEIHDLRDMLTLLRTLEVKPEAGRRKDLKKIETLVEDLRLLSETVGVIFPVGRRSRRSSRWVGIALRANP